MFQICADATLVFPLLVGETFARYFYTERNKISKDITSQSVVKENIKI
jgi:deoxyhypusine synthase